MAAADGPVSIWHKGICKLMITSVGRHISWVLRLYVRRRSVGIFHEYPNAMSLCKQRTIAIIVTCYLSGGEHLILYAIKVWVKVAELGQG